MCSYMGSEKLGSIQRLCSTFPRLTETNQQYVLGLAEGLKKAQNGRPKERQERGENELRKANAENGRRRFEGM